MTIGFIVDSDIDVTAPGNLHADQLEKCIKNRKSFIVYSNLADARRVAMDDVDPSDPHQFPIFEITYTGLGRSVSTELENGNEVKARRLLTKQITLESVLFDHAIPDFKSISYAENPGSDSDEEEEEDNELDQDADIRLNQDLSSEDEEKEDLEQEDADNEQELSADESEEEEEEEDKEELNTAPNPNPSIVNPSPSRVRAFFNGAGRALSGLFSFMTKPSVVAGAGAGTATYLYDGATQIAPTLISSLRNSLPANVPAVAVDATLAIGVGLVTSGVTEIGHRKAKSLLYSWSHAKPTVNADPSALSTEDPKEKKRSRCPVGY